MSYLSLVHQGHAVLIFVDVRHQTRLRNLGLLLRLLGLLLLCPLGLDLLLLAYDASNGRPIKIVFGGA